MSLVDGLLGPEEPEVGCDDCFAELDRYVELELAGDDPDAHPGSAPTWPAAWPAGRSTTASAPCSPARPAEPGMTTRRLLGLLVVVALLAGCDGGWRPARLRPGPWTRR